MTVPKLLLKSSYDVTTFSNGKSFPTKFLSDALPDVETALFFAKVYDLSPQDVSTLLHTVASSEVIDALTAQAGYHSLDLQDFLVEEFQDANGEWVYPDETFLEGTPGTKCAVRPELLAEMWKGLEVQIASSIAEVAETIAGTIGHMPGRTGEMAFKSLAKVNAQRPTIGQYQALIQHQQVKQVLVIFDVSGSMSENTVRTIVDDVVGLAYEANASLVIVSNSAFFYPPGGFSTQQVLEDAEYMGTHYEMLAPLFDGQNWDVVVTIADYDSAPSAAAVLARSNSRIQQLLDVSLVNRSTYLAQCLAPLADEVRPLLIAQDYTSLM
jgi:hypothetical protein